MRRGPRPERQSLGDIPRAHRPVKAPQDQRPWRAKQGHEWVAGETLPGPRTADRSRAVGRAAIGGFVGPWFFIQSSRGSIAVRQTPSNDFKDLETRPSCGLGAERYPEASRLW